MHNIFFVFTFTLIFCTLCLTQLKQTNRNNLTSHFYASTIHAWQNAQNKRIKSTFSSQNKDPNQGKKKSYPPNRFYKIIPSNAKLNIKHFQMDEKIEASPLFNLYQSYLLNIYQNAPFFSASAIKEIAIETAKAIKTTKDLKEIETIILKDMKLQEIWYKMLKGTREFEIQNPIGYPPFAHFFTFEDIKTRAPINFLKANHILLVSVFGVKMTQSIYEKEEIESRALNAQELEQLCQKENKAFETIKALLQFSNTKAIKSMPSTAIAKS